MLVESFHSDGALYMKAGFWALPMPELESMSNQLQGHNVLIQKLFWLVGDNILLWHNEFNEDTMRPQVSSQIAIDSDKVMNILSKLKCPAGDLDFKSCIFKALATLRMAGLIDEEYHQYTVSWVHALMYVNHQLPQLINTNIEKVCTNETVKFHPIDYSKGSVHKKPFSKKYYSPVSNNQTISQLVNKTCSKFSMPSDVKINLTAPWHQLDNVLLIVTFNNPHYEVIPFLEIMYRPFFPYILYCGPGTPNEHKIPLLKNFTFSFISYGSTPKGNFPGSFNYECTSMAVKSHYSVDGYLVIADDILLSMFRLTELLRHVVWFMPSKEVRIGEVTKLRECRLGMCDFHPRWRWWEDYQSQILAMLRRLKKNQYKSNLIYRCYKQIVMQTGAEMRAHGAYSDIYYLPHRLAADFAQLADMFRQEGVFLEVTVPTILKCLENPEDIQPIPGLIIWDEGRDYPWLYYKPKELKLKSFMHPTKWGYLARGSPDYAKFFCSQVIPFLHDPYGRIR